MIIFKGRINLKDIFNTAPCSRGRGLNTTNKLFVIALMLYLVWLGLRLINKYQLKV